MSIDLSRVTGISDSRGVITEIKDSLGRVIWAVRGGKAVLMVEKITSDTYAGETTYTGEQFILLDIYPKTNGTVKVTYGGLTKTITDTSGVAEPNAQQVFFGTFNGVSDSVATPASGELTIDGDCYGFAVGVFANSSKNSANRYNGVTAINDFGASMTIPDYAFYGCTLLSNIIIPKKIDTIGQSAFNMCTGLTDVEIENGLKKISANAFSVCPIETVYIPPSVNSLAYNAFSKSVRLTIDSKNESYKIDNNCLIDNAKNAVIVCYPDFTIPSYVSAIGERAAGAMNLTSLHIPGNVKVIGSSAFSGNEIDTLDLSEGVEELGDSAFYFALPTMLGITIPSTVKSIGSKCFDLNANLRSYRMLSTTPPLISSNSLHIDLKQDYYHIYVPKGCSEAYKTAPVWSDYASIIMEVS